MARCLKVLVACEYTGVVRRAFADRGHDAWSCDLLPSLDRNNKHIQGDVRDVLDDDWDFLMVAHPPCTRLCNSGVRWLFEPPGQLTAQHYSADEIAAYRRMNRDQRLAFMWHKLDEGAALFSTLWNAKIPRKVLENPVMHQHAKSRIRNYREFSQSIQPWMFGDFETKRTCFWTDHAGDDMPPLVPSYPTIEECRKALCLPINAKPADRVHKCPAGPKRWAERSKFFPGAAAALAEQYAG